MQKIYLPLLCACFLFFSFSVNAQDDCPGAVANINFSNGVCAIIGVNLVPNQNIALIGVDASLIE